MPRNTNKKNFSLRDELFNEKKAQYLAGLFLSADKNFEAKEFVYGVMLKLTELPLKERIVWIAQNLEKHLDDEFIIAADQILSALPPELDPENTDDDFGDFIFAPLGEFVVRNGLEKSNRKKSMEVVKEITKRFSMEDAIRYFINAFPEETMRDLEKWSKDRNYHVRRLASEGTRPLLPWSGRLSIQVNEPLPILENLYRDGTRYVVRSVANHLNDIAKTEPELVVKTLKKWQGENKKSQKQSEKELDWLTNHALRTLIKQGHPGALELIGYHRDPEITVSKITLSSDEIKIGQTLEFSFTIRAKKDENLLIDYIIDFTKANGKQSPKVYKIKKLKLINGEKAEIIKKHTFPKDATTIKIHPGPHKLTLQINGQKKSTKKFEVKEVM